MDQKDEFSHESRRRRYRGMGVWDGLVVMATGEQKKNYTPHNPMRATDGKYQQLRLEENQN